MIVPLLSLLLIAVAGIPWVALLARHGGYVMATASTVLLGFGATLGTELLTALLHLPMLPVALLLFAVAGALGITLCLRSRAVLPRRARSAWLPWLPALTGSLAWFGVVAAGQVVPGAARLAWIMQGDAANNVLFARTVVADGGIAVGENPVPLPAGLLALTMEFGRGAVGSADLLRHDISAFAALSVLLIGLCGAVGGLAAGAVARSVGASRLTTGAVAMLGSVVPYSWAVTGTTLEFGFFNSHPPLVVLAAAVVVALGGDRRPALSLAALTVASTLLLAAWSPLIVIPVALGFAIVTRSFRTLISVRGGALVVLVVGFGQLLAYGLLIVLPGLLAHGEALAAPGGIYPFPVVMLPLAIVGVIGLAALSMRGLRAWPARVVMALAVGSGAGLVVLLLASRGVWNYYQHKFAWLAAVVLVLIAIGLFVPALARARVPVGVAIGLCAVFVAGLVIASPSDADGARRLHPFA